jgi:hypothetical protein
VTRQSSLGDAKFAYNFWRPIQAIQKANTVAGDTAITQDPNWLPLITTPPFPEYVSGHSTFSGTAATILDNFFGTNVSFTVGSVGLPGVTRSFSSFDAAAQEAASSRLWGGIHFTTSINDGLTAGKQLGNLVLARFAEQKDTAPPTITITGPTNNIAVNADLTVAGQVTDNLSGVASLQAALDGGAFAPVSFDASGRFSVPVTLATDGSADGAHVLHLKAVDYAGNATPSANFNFTLVTKKPTITLTAPAQSGALAAGATVTGTASASGAEIVSLTYSFDSGMKMPISFGPDGSFNQTLDLSKLAAGSHTLTVTAIDSAGNSAVTTLNLSLEAMIPLTLTSVSPAAGSSDIGSTFRPKITFSRAIDSSTLTGSDFFATDTTGAKLAATVVPSDDGTYAWLFFTNSMPGASTITITVDGSTIKTKDGALLDAAGSGTPGSKLTSAFSTVSLAALPNTSLSGIVADPGSDLQPGTLDDVSPGPDGVRGTADDVYKLPIAGVTVSIVGTNLTTTTDATGHFTFASIPTGDVKLELDGTTATNAPAGIYFPQMVMDLLVTPGVANTVMADMAKTGSGNSQPGATISTALGMYLPRVQTQILKAIAPTGMTQIGVDALSAPDLTPQQRQMLSINIPGGVAIGMNGQKMISFQAGISVVPPSIVMDMLPPGVMQHTFDITIQAPGVATFSTPVPMSFPNVFNAAPGTKLNFLSFDHTTGRLVIDGTATVSSDGNSVATDPGTGITHPGWHGLTPPGPTGRGDAPRGGGGGGSGAGNGNGVGGSSGSDPGSGPLGGPGPGAPGSGDPGSTGTGGNNNGDSNTGPQNPNNTNNNTVDIAPIPVVTNDGGGGGGGGSLIDYFFTDDSGAFTIDLQNDATPADPNADPSSGDNANTIPLDVTLEVDGPAEEFLNGLQSDSYSLLPGDQQQVDVTELPLLDSIKDLTADQFYDFIVHITAYADNDPGTLLVDKMFNVSRYEAVVDPHAPSLNALAQALSTYRHNFNLPSSPVGIRDGTTITIPFLSVSANGHEALSGDASDAGTVLADGPGGRSGVISVVLTNNGLASLSLGSIILANSGTGFSIVGPNPTGTSLNPGESATLTIAFDPSAPGPASNTVTIASNSAGGAIFSLKLIGIGLSTAGQVHLQLAPDPVSDAPTDNFGGLRLGAPARLISTFATVTNTGGGPLSVSGIVLGRGSNDFTLTGLPGFPLALAPGQSFHFGLRFNPAATGLRTGEIDISSDDPATPVLHQPVVGTGLAAAGSAAHWGDDFVMMRVNGNSIPMRFRSDINGDFHFNLPPKTTYDLSVYDPQSGLVWNQAAVSKAAGKFTDLGRPFFFASTFSSSRADGLPDDIADIMGPGRFYDFGTPTSPVMPGYTQVTPSNLYAPVSGFGWMLNAGQTVSGVDQASSSAPGVYPLTRDFNSTASGTFAVDLPNGVYDVTVTLGDALAAHATMTVTMQGELRGNLSTTAGQFITDTYRVEVRNGQLQVAFAGEGRGQVAFDGLGIVAVPGATLSNAPLVGLAGLHYFALENVQTGFIMRGSIDLTAGEALCPSGVLLSPNASYREYVFQASSLEVGVSDFTTPASGVNFTMPEIVLGADTSPDSDHDGLHDRAEFIIGTNSNKADTNGDGINDLASVQQGIDPLGGVGFPTGVIATVPLSSTAKAVDVEGSASGGQTAFVAQGAGGLAIIDVSQFSHPAVLSQLALPGDATGVADDPSVNIVAPAAPARRASSTSMAASPRPAPAC